MGRKRRKSITPKKPVTVRCPNCHSRITGKLGANRFFCADCCQEFVIKNKSTISFSLSINGDLEQAV